MSRISVFLLLSLVIGGCGDDRMMSYGAGDPKVAPSRVSAEPAFLGIGQRREGELRAYAHNVVVDTGEAKLAEAYEVVTEACNADRENQCTLLNTNIDLGDYSRAHVSMRVKRDGIEALVSLAADAGEIISQSTHTEDLAKTIADVDKRVAILTTTRDRLLELEERGTDDVESLIKITTELTRVQAELEELQGQGAYQRQRVETDILTIEFRVDAKRSFWSPIGDALSAFGRNLSRGLGDTITAIAYLLPWSILVFFVGWLLRILWKRMRTG